VSVSPGSTAKITVNVTSSVARSALVDVEVYGSDGRRVAQFVFDGQAFAAGGTKTYPIQWKVPANGVTGLYTVKVGVFSVGWGVLYHWNNQGATFNVTSGSGTGGGGSS
jgi:hypothetical protein